MQGKPKIALRLRPHNFEKGSEIELSAELHHTRRMSACGLSKGAVSKTSVYDPQIGVIEEVEGLSAHLKIHTFIEPEILQQAQINLFHAWTQDVSNLTTAKVALGRSEGVGSEPLGLSLSHANCRHLIGASENVIVWTLDA